LAAAYDAATTYYSSPTEVMPRAKEAALQAVALDPNLASAHVGLAMCACFTIGIGPRRNSNIAGRWRSIQACRKRNWVYANYLATLGHFDEALSRVQQAYLFDPLALESRKEALWIYYFSGRMPETSSKPRKRSRWNQPLAFLMRCSRWPMHRWGSALKLSRLQRTPFGLRTAVDNHTTAAALAHVGQSREAKQLLSKALEQAKERYVCDSSSRIPIGAWRYGESV